MSQISLPWQRGLVAVEFAWRHALAQPRKPPAIRKDLGNIFCIRLVIADFVPNFVAMATGLVAVEFAWRRAIARPRKPPAIREDLRYISCISRVIADYVPNFAAMATGVGRSRICLASFNSSTPKTPCSTQRSPGYLLYKPSYSRFCPKFRCHGNGGWSQ